MVDKSPRPNSLSKDLFSMSQKIFDSEILPSHSESLSQKILCVWGHSGVGKSRFINQLLNKDITKYEGPIFQSCCRGDPATKNPTLFTNIKLNDSCNKRIVVFDNKMNFLASYEPTSINNLEMINEYNAKFLVVYLPSHVYGKNESIAAFECKDIKHVELLYGLHLTDTFIIRQESIIPIFLFSTPRVCYVQVSRKQHKDCGFESGFCMFMEKFKFTDEERNDAMEWMKDERVDFYNSRVNKFIRHLQSNNQTNFKVIPEFY